MNETFNALGKPLTGPTFSSYDAMDVQWLLTDLSDLPLEREVEERYLDRSEGKHYSEDLPIEYVPSREYLEAYEWALSDGIQELVQAVADVAGLIRRQRGERVVLASLARAGTPMGILIRRYAFQAWGLDWPHFTLSIILGRGLDPAALDYLRTYHDPSQVVFVDGWTGKGAITRELKASLRDHKDFVPQIAVVADPGHCADLSGTRNDVLIPSSCLNSTVSGLISRTVVPPNVITPGMFHGAKYYSHLHEHDRSNQFIDSVVAHFANVRPQMLQSQPPTWRGWDAVVKVAGELGIENLSLIKPGIGETTRVLLRRVPERILVDESLSDPEGRLAHIFLLAADRNVPIHSWSGLPYACIGIAASETDSPK
jgi:hypothetical protein